MGPVIRSLSFTIRFMGSGVGANMLLRKVSQGIYSMWNKAPFLLCPRASVSPSYLWCMRV